MLIFILFIKSTNIRKWQCARHHTICWGHCREQINFCSHKVHIPERARTYQWNLTSVRLIKPSINLGITIFQNKQALGKFMEKTWLPIHLWAGPRWDPLPLPLVLECGSHLPFWLAEAAPRTKFWNNDVVLRTPSQCTQLNRLRPVKIWQPVQGPTYLAAAQDKPRIFKFPLLFKTATHLSGVCGLFFPISPCSSCSRDQFLISPGKLQRVANQHPERSLKHKPVYKYRAQVNSWGVFAHTWSTTRLSSPLPSFQFVLVSLP